MTRGSFSTWWPLRTRPEQRRSLLRLIAVAAEQNLPLAPLVAAWADDERGTQKRRVLRLARLLEAGTPLPEAVEEVPGVLRDEDVLAIRFGAQSGTLAAAIREALEQSQRPSAALPPRARKTLVYCSIVILLSIPIIAFTQIKIVPEFRKILEEFDLEQFTPLEWMRPVASFIDNFWWVGALIVLALLASTFSARPGRFVRHTILGRLFGSLRELRSAEVLQNLSVATQAGRPIPGALSTLARYHFDPNIRHKLLFVRNEVEQGADVWQSMTAVGLLTAPEVGLLETAERVGNRPWALKQLALVKQRRTMRHLERLSELLLPVIVLMLGAFVLFQAATVFLFLARIIQSLL